VAGKGGHQAGSYRGCVLPWALIILSVSFLVNELTYPQTFLFPETEKYAHVTFFFNGGVEKQFDNEERHMIPSPKVATYDLQPQMSVKGVADKVAEVLKKGEHEFVMCNFAPPDMVRSSPPSFIRIHMTPFPIPFV